MEFEKIIIQLVSVFLIILAIDFVWLGLIAKNFYFKELGTLKKQNINWISAILVYVILALGIYVFVLSNFSLSFQQSIIFGALFGFVVYSVYDFTNFATLSKYSLKLTIVDILWGTILCGLTSGIFRLFFRI
jgi:uncharacterized membrane protein